MWSITRQGWFSPRYGVEENGRPVGTVELGKWRECGAIALEGRRLSIRREGFWSTRYHLQDGERTLATARPTNGWRGGFWILHERAGYLVERSSFLSRSYNLLRGSRHLGEVRAVGFCSRMEAVVDPEVARELGLFAVWLVMLERRRAAVAVVGVAGFAAASASS